MTREASCPSCGAKIAFRSAASVVAICDFCKSTLVRQDLNLENVGKMAELKADGSPLRLGAEGTYRQVHFAVAGRIQYRFDQGLWNEWHLVFDDMRSGWLGEARGTYAVSFRSEVTEPIPAFAELEVGKAVTFDRRVFEIADIQNAVCIGGEGELPFPVGAGYEAPVADLQGSGHSFGTIDYSEDPPLVFLGDYVEFDELELSGLRELDGW
jgi:uncharacterized protein DUF4178